MFKVALCAFLCAAVAVFVMLAAVCATLGLWAGVFWYSIGEIVAAVGAKAMLERL